VKRNAADEPRDDDVHVAREHAEVYVDITDYLEVDHSDQRDLEDPNNHSHGGEVCSLLNFD